MFAEKPKDQYEAVSWVCAKERHWEPWRAIATGQTSAVTRLDYVMETLKVSAMSAIWTAYLSSANRMGSARALLLSERMMVSTSKVKR